MKNLQMENERHVDAAGGRKKNKQISSKIIQRI